MKISEKSLYFNLRNIGLNINWCRLLFCFLSKLECLALRFGGFSRPVHLSTQYTRHVLKGFSANSTTLCYVRAIFLQLSRKKASQYQRYGSGAYEASLMLQYKNVKGRYKPFLR